MAAMVKPPKTKTPSLGDLRKEIDHIDEAMHTLLMQRGARWIPGAGLIDGPIWYQWSLQLSRGPVDLGAIKQAVMRLLGPGAPANAVTLALLDEEPDLVLGRAA